MKPDVIRHEFVEFIPRDLDEGVIYVSIPFATVVHNCYCGCGNRVVTPLTPTDWELTYDGETVSLSPSIGNWNFPCQSHYWVRHGQISWASKWSAEEIARGRKRDKLAKQRHFEHVEAIAVDDVATIASVPASSVSEGFWRNLWHKFRLRLSRIRE